VPEEKVDTSPTSQSIATQLHECQIDVAVRMIQSQNSMPTPKSANTPLPKKTAQSALLKFYAQRE